MTGTKPQHAPQIHFPVVDDVLQVGGIALPRLAQRVGRTPFYAIDRAVCSAQVAGLRAAEGQVLEIAGERCEVLAEGDPSNLPVDEVTDELLVVPELRQPQRLAASEQFLHLL